MEFHAVIAEPKVGEEPVCLYVGTDAVKAQAAYHAHDAGRVSHFRLHQSQAFESRDLSVTHGAVHGTAKPEPAPKAVNAADLPGPKPGEIVQDLTTGQDLIRPAANPHQLNVLPTDPAAREAAIREAEGFRDAALQNEVAPADPDRAAQIEQERQAADENLADKLKGSPLLPAARPRSTAKGGAK